MDKHWGSYCTMSIVHFMAFPDTSMGEGPIVESVRTIAEDDFFDAIEIAWIKDATAERFAIVDWLTHHDEPRKQLHETVILHPGGDDGSEFALSPGSISGATGMASSFLYTLTTLVCLHHLAGDHMIILRQFKAC